MNTTLPQAARLVCAGRITIHSVTILVTLFAFISANTSLVVAQTGSIEIHIVDANTKQKLVGATAQVIETRQGAIARDSGIAIIKHIKPGAYRLKIGGGYYQALVLRNVKIIANRTLVIEAPLGLSLTPTTADDLVRLQTAVSKFAISEINIVSSGADAGRGGYTGGDIGGGVLAPSETKSDMSFSGSRGNSNSLKMNGSIQQRVDALVRLTPPAPSDYNQYRQSAPANQEAYASLTENQFLGVRQNPLSTFSIDVDVASYANIRRMLMDSQTPEPDAVRIEEMINYFHYDYPQPEGKVPFAVRTELADCPWDARHQILQIGLQGKTIAKENLPPSNLVFLIDVSGSMDIPEKLPLLQRAFRLLVKELRPIDKVAIVVYAGNAGLVLPSTSGDQKAKILATIDKLEAGGSTNGGAGIMLAYKIAKENFIENGINRVILATDGDFNVGVSSEGGLVRLMEEKRKENIYISLLAFGRENLKDSQMEKIADKGNGNYAYIDNILEAQKVLVTQMGGTLYTIAKDVKLQLEFNPAAVKGYRLIGYEDRMLAKEDFNNDLVDAGELGAGHSVTALYELIPASSSEVVPHDSVDALKYQTTGGAVLPTAANELVTIKLRYKDPKDTVSKLVQHTVAKENALAFAAASDNLRFSAAVAGFGMLLRHSEFAGDATIQSITELAQSARGKDDEGYRAEFIKLLRLYTALDEDKALK
jgi:Ca-activated chloride channel family protein